MKKNLLYLTLSSLVLCMGMTAWAEEEAMPTQPSTLRFELENQTPCFFFGGYQLSVGIRRDQWRYRASVQNSGHADFEGEGIDRRNSKFQRDYDNGSFSISADYFLNKYFFTYATLGSNRWLLRNKETSATDNLRTLDAGLGLGIQYFFCQHVFIQLAGHVNFRESKSLTIENEEYTIPSMDVSPGLRLGYRF